MKLPLHQRAIKIVAYILGGFFVLGSLLDSIVNAISLLTPSIAIIGTVSIGLGWLLAHIILPLHPLPWVFGIQRVRITKLGIKPTAFAVGMVILLWLPSVVKPIITQGQTPDVVLRFVYPKSPALVLVNQSAVVARNIKWMVVLWNMDIPERNDPLPIPVSTFDWLRPHDQGGPQNLFDSPHVAPLLKPGNRLFGSASVICPECARGRTYVVYITWGEGGWFSEVKSVKSGKVLIPSNFLKASRIEYFQELKKAASEQSRTPIGELTQ